MSQAGLRESAQTFEDRRTLIDSEVLDAGLLHVGLLDLSREPSGSVLRLVDHCGRAGEAVYLVRSALAQTDIGVTACSCLERCATGLLAHEDLGCILVAVHQHEVFLARH